MFSGWTPGSGRLQPRRAGVGPRRSSNQNLGGFLSRRRGQSRSNQTWTVIPTRRGQIRLWSPRRMGPAHSDRSVKVKANRWPRPPARRSVPTGMAAIRAGQLEAEAVIPAAGRRRSPYQEPSCWPWCRSRVRHGQPAAHSGTRAGLRKRRKTPGQAPLQHGGRRAEVPSTPQQTG